MSLFIIMAGLAGLLAGLFIGSYRATLKWRRENDVALRRRSALVYATSHELRTPLSNILGLINSLRDEGALLNERSSSQLQKLSDSTGALHKMVLDSLEIFQLAEKKLRVEPRVVNLSELVEKKLTLFQQAVSRRGSPVRIDSAIAKNIWVEADPARINQCLTAIMKQALFQTRQGQITVKLAAQKARAANTTLVGIVISDDSEGVDQSIADKFFIPQDYQENPYLHGRPGAMLSINLAKGVAEAMGGRLDVKSAPGAGVAFTLRLALKAAARKSDQAAAETEDMEPVTYKSGPVSGAKVLVVDDDETNLLIMESYLRASGAAEIMLAPNGLTAVELAKQHAFDLILMDLQMPDIDGLEATRRIRKGRGPCSTAPIIAVSASSRIVNEAICTEAGMNGFVEKPVDIRILMTAIKQAGLAGENKTGRRAA